MTTALTEIPVSARYVRIWMTASSNTCDSHGSSDLRNCVGYAIRELYAGTIGEDGQFQRLRSSRHRGRASPGRSARRSIHGTPRPTS